MSTSALQVQGPHPADHLLQVLVGYIKSSALYAVTKLGIADLLATGEKPVRELAQASKTNEDALYRAMRALASDGVFMETSPRVFALTPAGEYLCAGRAGTLRDMVLWWADPFHFKLYPEMLHAIKTGETVVEKVFGVSCFDYLAKDKEVSDEFNAAMTEFSKSVTGAVLEAYDFSWLDGKTLVDVGGGHGQLLTAILKAHPGVRGMIYDVDHVVAGTRERVEQLGLSNRCQVAGGDFFECVPGGDAYIMKHIIHDWNDERALKILKNCHRAANGPAKVILVEAILKAGNEPHIAKWLDMEMLMLPGGRERTEQEFAQLFERAGFRLARVLPTKSPVCVLEAERAN